MISLFTLLSVKGLFISFPHFVFLDDFLLFINVKEYVWLLQIQSYN